MNPTYRVEATRWSGENFQDEQTIYSETFVSIEAAEATKARLARNLRDGEWDFNPALLAWDHPEITDELTTLFIFED